jgi:hypothetical protein
VNLGSINSFTGAAFQRQIRAQRLNAETGSVEPMASAISKGTANEHSVVATALANLVTNSDWQVDKDLASYLGK